MSRTTFEGPHDVGRINSYVIIPVGARRLVAMVNRVVLVEEAEIQADRTMVTLPSARRIMKATLIGTIDGLRFQQGISLFPVLDSSVYLPSRQDLDAIFGPIELSESGSDDPTKPGFRIPVGESTVVPGRPIRINPDTFFGKHAAILGSTGSGKSCTVASILQSICEQAEVKRTTCIILDTNGEYRTAFQQQNEGVWENAGEAKCLYVPSDPMQKDKRLKIPYWFMNTEDFVRLFQASKGVQRPVLLEALRLARNESSKRNPTQLLKAELILELGRLWSLAGRDERTSKDVRDLAAGLKRRLGEDELSHIWDSIEQEYQFRKDDLISAVEYVSSVATQHIDNGTYPKMIPADARTDIRRSLDPIYTKLTGTSLASFATNTGHSADSPSYFDKVTFRSRHIEQVLRREESGGTRARDFSGTMLLRIDRLLADNRFDFLFGPVGESIPDAENALAAFLRDLLGIGADQDAHLSDETAVPVGCLPFYDRQRDRQSAVDLVILDMSLLASEVLENVTALIGRLTLEFLQRLGETGGIDARGSLPVVLVLEEAQNYIQQSRFGEEESIARDVFERIAREGRKYGLSLVVASQRPSELSRTVLSQCSSFIVHRLQNPEDLRYFKEIVPGIYGPMLEQLPALAPQTALVLGECVAAPALVRIRNAEPTPESRDPLFYKHWIDTEDPAIDVEKVCDSWIGEVENENDR